LFWDRRQGDGPLVKEPKNIFQNWNNRAWVRKPELDYQHGGGDLFAAKLYPAVGHKLVAERGDDFQAKLLAQRLLSFLDFTARLERTAVTPITLLVAGGDLPVKIPKEVRQYADVVCIDEAKHAFESVRLEAVIVDQTGVQPAGGYPRSLTNLRELTASVPTTERWLWELAFAIVSETLISGVLSKLPHDKSVDSRVCDYVGAHAEDEGRHHQLFASILEHVWPQLTLSQQELCGPFVPVFMRWFLEPDHGPTIAFLQDQGFTSSAIERIIADSYPEPDVIEGIRNGATAGIRHFERVGALFVPAIREAFEREGLL